MSTENQIAVALTFDFDGESVWIGDFGHASPSAVSRGTYAATEGVPRLLRLLARHEVRATFFVPGYTAERHADVTRSIVDAGHELGHHGYMHEPPQSLDVAAEREMLEKGLQALGTITDAPIVGYRSPGWELSENTLDLLDEYGFAYDASQLGADRPYWATRDGRGIVELPSSWELCDSAHFMYLQEPVYHTGLAAPSKVEEIWLGDFDGLYREGGDCCYVLTMHPEYMGRPHRVQLLDRVLDHMKQQTDVWFATMREVNEEFRARETGLPSPFRGPAADSGELSG